MIEEKVFLSKDYSETYPFLRKMDTVTFEKYLNIIMQKLKTLKRPIKLLDVGCGTGNFSVLFTSQLGEENCKIHAVDKSPQMLKIAQQQIREHGYQNIEIWESDVADLAEACSGEQYDLIFSSEMIHLVKDVKPFFKDLHQLLTDDGVLAIRTSTHRQLFERDWYHYFKGTLTIDLERHKSEFLLKSALTDAGFMAESHTMDESEYINREQYVEMFRNKCYSTLRLIPDEEFDRCFAAFEQNLPAGNEVYRNYEMTLYLAAKGKCAHEKA